MLLRRNWLPQSLVLSLAVLLIVTHWQRLLTSAILNGVFISLVDDHSIQQGVRSPSFGVGLRVEVKPSQALQESWEVYNPNWNDTTVGTADVSRQMHVLEMWSGIDRSNERALRLLGRFYLVEHKWSKALAILEKATQSAHCQDAPMSEGCGYLWIDLGDAHDALGQPEEALQLYLKGQALGRREAVTFILAERAQRLLTAGDQEAAKLTLESIPSDLRSLLAIQGLSVRVNNDPTAWDGLRYFQLSSLRPAQDPRLEEINAEITDWLIRTGIWDTAQLERIVAYRIWKYARWPSIERYIQHLIQYLPSDGMLWYYCGQYYERNADWEKSLSCYEQTRSLEPGKIHTALRLAVVWVNLAWQDGTPSDVRWDRFERAMTWLEGYIAVRPADLFAAHLRDDLREWLNDKVTTLAVENRSTSNERGNNMLANSSDSKSWSPSFEKWYPERPWGWSGLAPSNDSYNSALLVLGSDSLEALGRQSARIDCLWTKPGVSPLASHASLWYWDEAKNARGTVPVSGTTTLTFAVATRVEGEGQVRLYGETTDQSSVSSIDLASSDDGWGLKWVQLSSETPFQSLYLALVIQGCTRTWLDRVSWAK